MSETERAKVCSSKIEARVERLRENSESSERPSFAHAQFQIGGTRNTRVRRENSRAQEFSRRPLVFVYKQRSAAKCLTHTF